MKIVFHPEAYEEMIESARFYEERDYVKEVTNSEAPETNRAAIDKICAHPIFLSNSNNFPITR